MTPRPRLLLAAALVVPIFIASIWAIELRLIGTILNLGLLSLAIADRIVSPGLHWLKVSREVSSVLSVGAPNPVRVHVFNPSSQPLSIELIDEFPTPATSSDFPLSVSVPPGTEREVKYSLQPQRRGRSTFKAVHLRMVSRLGLWTLQERREVTTDVRLYPDIRAVYRFELMARKNRLEELGLKMHRLRGQGSEFERLREYRREDEYRQIDWKATARTQQLVSREFNVERNQNVLIMLDCGRSMRNESGGLAYIDRALNAAIMLSYIALGQGDSVGFYAFSSRLERAIKPVRGKPAIQTIIQHSFDLEARSEASDYSAAFEQIRRRYRKRSLAILLTHVIDDQHLEAISRQVRSWRSPHLFLLVFLKDLGLTNLADSVPSNEIEAFETGAAAELLVSLAKSTATLRESGIMLLETLPQNLSAELINQYLDIKARHLM